ncbi:MAG: D-alanyl-D-alanine carboxypeptidase/D-alanyl-D-alanine-endopeptidase [bacterium]|nr:D-alanyl-D-alanine carboxypeptidase/D-alanyl-D-alanine-endopeptidase [bacterium]
MRIVMKGATLTALLGILLLGTAPQPSPSPTPTPPHAAGDAWSAREIRALHGAIARALDDPTLRGARVGLVARDAERGTLLFARDADAEFTPASNFKLLVGTVALARLGPTFAYATYIIADAPLADGTIAGNLYLRGGGDALLSEDDLRAAASALAANGLRHVAGDVVTDASHFDAVRYGAGWSWDDLPFSYAPVVSALELDDGTAHVFLEPGARQGEPAVVIEAPASTAFELRSEVRTGARGSDDTSTIERPWDEPRAIVLAGSYPLDAGRSDDLAPSVPDPPSFAGDVFARALAAAGVRVDGAVRAGATPAGTTVLWTHASEPMPRLLADFWYPSDNLMGELLLKELGVAQSGEPGTTEHGRALELGFLRSIGVDPATVDIADGSGLSIYDRITPNDLIALLQYDWASSDRAIVLDALPVAGVRGTLAQTFLDAPLRGNVFAKTGSLTHVRTISGFVQNERHGAVSFSLLVNDWMGDRDPTGAAALDRVRAAILTALATL